MRFRPTGDQLCVEFEGWEKLWALKRRLVIPRTAVVEVDFWNQEPVLQDFRGYLRIPGTAVPWRFVAGSFWREASREFWYVRFRQAGLLTIELQKGAFPYDRLRLSCDPLTAQAVADWWRGAQPAAS